MACCAIASDSGNGYVYVKMRHIDLIRLHAKMFEWGGEHVSFCVVRNVLPINPQDPMDENQVARISYTSCRTVSINNVIRVQF